MRFIAFIAAASASTLFPGCSATKAEDTTTTTTTTATPTTTAKPTGGAAKSAVQAAISPVAQRTVSDLKKEPVVGDMDALDKLAQASAEQLGLDSDKVREITSKGRALIAETRLMDVNGKLKIGELEAQVRKAVKPVVEKLEELVREHRRTKLNDVKPLVHSEAIAAQLAKLADKAIDEIERLRDGESVKAVLKNGKLQKELVKLVDVVMAELDGDKPAKKSKADKKPKADKKSKAKKVKKVAKKPKADKKSEVEKKPKSKKAKRAAARKEDTSNDEALALQYHYDDAKIALERQHAAARKAEKAAARTAAERKAAERKAAESERELNEHKTLEMLAAEKVEAKKAEAKKVAAKKAASEKKRAEEKAEVAEVEEQGRIMMLNAERIVAKNEADKKRAEEAARKAHLRVTV